INTNIGTSPEKKEYKDEIEKLKIAISLGTDTVMDLSTGGNLKKIRKEIIKYSSVPVGTVPIYEIAKNTENKKGSFDKFTLDDILEVITEQAKDGVDFFTIHAGILKNTLNIIKENKRVGGIVSRGGAILARWMYVNNKENPLYESFDKILSIAKEYNIVISLGDALRPGAVADSTDTLQIQELKVLSELVKVCLNEGVQVMVEGPGHIKLDEIGTNILLAKKLCRGVPFYVFGPLPTDIASGYDHITSAIGGAIAGLNGADFLCVVTPAEHLRHPSIEDIKEGIIASKIAAHSVDILHFPEEWQKDLNLSLYRKKRDWPNIFKLSINKNKAEAYRKSLETHNTDICTMCGKFCSLKILDSCNLYK
ncbi:MAG: phosphomethylpyrimidine synthase ThiC, partial [Candidatus Omnitrophica bacterium]|nr:phosphomethylpyrimidine synthase ThiC [Candidatus Omnitrophota bacterium]